MTITGTELQDGITEIAKMGETVWVPQFGYILKNGKPTVNTLAYVKSIMKKEIKK